jgi:hypothetical protein
MFQLKLISNPQTVPAVLNRADAEYFLREFENGRKAKIYPRRELRKKLFQALLTLGHASPAELEQIHLSSEAAKINFWYYFFYKNLYIFKELGPSLRQAVWRIIQEQLQATPDSWLASLQNILNAVQQRKINAFQEESRLRDFIQASSFNYFTLPLYRHYTALAPERQKQFLQSAARVQQLILADTPWPEVKKLLSRRDFLDRRGYAFDLLLQVMPWHTAFPANNAQTMRNIFRANVSRDAGLRAHLADRFPALSGRTLEHGGRFYRIGKSAWHIPFGGLADICTADRPAILWQSPEFNLISIFDTKQYLGFLMLLFQNIPGLGRYLILYGSEPAAALVRGQETRALYQEFVAVCQEFAGLAGLDGVAQTGCPAWYSNRPQLRDYIENFTDDLPRTYLPAVYTDYWDYRTEYVYLLPENPDPARRSGPP